MKSMTGYGRAEGVSGDFRYTVEMKSVNHRFLEVRTRIPPSLGLIDHVLSERIKARFERGAFEVNVKSSLATGKGVIKGKTRFVLDELALRSLVKSVAVASKILAKPLDISVEALLQSERAIVATEKEGTSNSWRALKPVLDKAMDELEKMRMVEGAKLEKLLSGQAHMLEKISARLRKETQLQPQAVGERVRERIRQWKLESVDARRLELEVAMLAEKADVTEELDRLGHHLGSFSKAIQADATAGRKLDFILQEMNREVNTLGAKVAVHSASLGVIEAKGIIEKLREQVQNVE